MYGITTWSQSCWEFFRDFSILWLSRCACISVVRWCGFVLKQRKTFEFFFLGKMWHFLMSFHTYFLEGFFFFSSSSVTYPPLWQITLGIQGKETSSKLMIFIYIYEILYLFFPGFRNRYTNNMSMSNIRIL